MSSSLVRKARQLLVMAAVLAGVAVQVTAADAGGTGAEQKARNFINRYAMDIHNYAHTGAKFTSMQYSRSDQNLNGFTLTYQHEWVSSLTNNKNSTTWSFQFDSNGKFRDFSYNTTWPTGAFEGLDLTIEATRRVLLNDKNLTDATARQLIQNAPSGRELFRIMMTYAP